MRKTARVALLAILLAGGALAQGATPQARIDAAPAGSALHLEAGDHEGPLRIAKPLAVLGVDQQTRLLAPADAVALTIDATDATFRFVWIETQGVAIELAPGARANLGPLSFGPARVGLRLGEGAMALLRNDPQMPGPIEMAPSSRLLYTRTGMLEARDAATGAPIEALVATLRGGDGDALAAYGPVPGGRLEVDVPHLARSMDGSLVPAPPGATFLVRAPGYEEAVLPVARLGEPLALEPASPPSEGAPAEGLESAASPPRPGAVAPRAPPPPPMVVAAVAVAGAGVAATGVALVVLRSERRLWNLLAFLAPLYSRLRKGALLDQPTRERIHAHVAANPGVHYRALQRATALPNGVLAHHLRVLLREGLLQEAREGRAVRFFVPGQRPERALDTGERVLDFVRANPGATGSQVAEALGVSSSLAGYHLQRLEAVGRLRRAREGFRVRAYARDP